MTYSQSEAEQFVYSVYSDLPIYTGNKTLENIYRLH